MKFYATGTMTVKEQSFDEKGKAVETSRTVTFVMENEQWESRLDVVNDVKSFARTNGISNVDIRPVGKVEVASTMTKNAKERRAKRTLQHKKNWLKKQKKR
jgi:hypothetical protein